MENRHDRERVFLLTLLGLLVLPTSSQARDQHATSPYLHRISPQIRIWLSSPSLRRDDPEHRASPLVEAPVSIRFTHSPTPRLLQQLEQKGVRLHHLQGEAIRHLGRYYPARVTLQGVLALAQTSQVERVELDAMIVPAVPLDFTGLEIEAPATWATTREGVPLTGRGLTAGVIDSGIDIFHPAFFHPDGGLFAWLDVDQNGQFDPCTDAVDLNANEQADTDETLCFFDSVVYDLYHQTVILDSKNSTLDVGRDWLYADQNGNKKRDFGQAGGFDDSSPSLGEPLFVIDDLNHNQVLDPEEKIVGLKTSKVKTYYYQDTVRLRGKDLVLTEDQERDFHGTGTSGIMVAGQLGSQQWVGIIPEADLAMATTDSSDGQRAELTDRLIWLVQEVKADIVLHEYAPWVGFHLDGSSNMESLIDQATKLGIPQITPAGNLGGSDKHMRQTLAAGSTTSIGIHVPSPAYMGTFTYMQLTFLWRDLTADLEFTLTDPQGNSHPLAYLFTKEEPWDASGLYYGSYREDSSRGTAMLNAYLYTQQGSSAHLPSGNWTLTVKHPGASGSVELLGYVMDEVSTWSKAVAFTQSVSEKGLIGWPATADSAITVSAYTGHAGLPYDDGPDSTGDFRAYSGRGVRIDGVSIMDLAAPDNPISPLSHSWYAGLGSYMIFGGTSGAGPHVAAAALLIKQHDPTLGGAAIRSALQAGTLVDAQVGSGPFPLETWGYGKLRIYESIYQQAPVPNTSPTAQILVEGQIYAGDAVSLTPEVKDNEDASAQLLVRWDEGYDGSYETEFGEVAPWVRTYAQAGTVRIKLEVQDSGGLTGGAAILLQVLPAIQRPDAGPIPDAGVLDSGVTVDAVTSDSGAAEPVDDGCSCGLAADTSPLRMRGDALFVVIVLLGIGVVRRNNCS